MSEPKKPRLAEVLGVEVGEKFTLRDGKEELSGLHVEEDGTIHDRYEASVSGSIYSFLINHPESIIRAPRLTEPEIAICKAVGAKWVAREKDSAWVTLHLEKPEQFQPGNYGYRDYIGTLDENLFPSVALGACISVDEPFDERNSE